MVSEADGELIGGRYRLLESVGVGGMGRVWRGRDELLDREVAVKEIVFPSGMGAAEREVFGKRAMREARSAARLNHPGIITVHDVITRDGAPVIVMEFVRGLSLDQRIKRQGRLAPVEVARIGAMMAQALGEAHAAGIVHRDLKPANVLLMGDRVVITDFGIASLAGDAALTTSGALLGTPAFMAPEQAHGLPVTPACDLWSLGATLYAAVEGRPPYAGTNLMAILSALLSQDPAPPVHAGPLAPVLAGLLRKDPARRLTVGEAGQVLLALIHQSRPHPYPSTTLPLRSSVPEDLGALGPAGRYPGDGTEDTASSQTTSPAPAVAEARAADRQPVRSHDRGRFEAAPAAAETGGRLLRRRSLILAGLGAVIAVGVPVKIALNGDDDPEPQQPPAVKSWSAIAPLTGHTGAVYAVAFSPDGKILASGSADRTARLWDLAGGKSTVTLTGYLGGVYAVAFSPDGKILATGSGDGTVRLWDVAGSRTLATLDEHTGPVISMAFRPDGEILATGSADRTVRLWDVASRKTVTTITGHTSSVDSMSFSPDGKTLATSSRVDNVARLWDVTSHGRANVALLTGHTKSVLAVAFSSDEKTLATAGDDETVRLWDVAGRRTVATLAGTAYALAFSPDGGTLAIVSLGGIVRLWDVINRDTVVALAGRGNIWPVTFSPDGETVAIGSEDKNVQMWRAG